MFASASPLVRCLAAFVLCSVSFSGWAETDEKYKEWAERTRFLLLDDRLIDNTENAKLTVSTAQKHPSNPLFCEDEPWEKRFDNLYGNVIYDEEEEIYKCWYSPFIQDESAAGMTLAQRKAQTYRPLKFREMAILYATSKDGIRWEKPDMDLVDFEGSKANNILWRGNQERENLWKGPHGSGIFKDLLDSDPDRRYKAILKADIISVAFSPDGLHWGEATTCPEADVAGDTHNNAFWAPTLNKYVGITREWGREPDAPHVRARDLVLGKSGRPRRWRQVARIESEDFVNWTKAEVVLEGIDTDHQTYAMPVFFYGGVYLGLLAVHQQSTDRVWTELTWSPDTRSWHRISPGTPLIPNSPSELDYDWGCVYACAVPVFKENEIQLYYGGSDWLHTSWRNGYLCLATLRPDGFAGWHQDDPDHIGKVTTALIDIAGDNVMVTADIESGGFLRAVALDKNENVLAVSEKLTNSVTRSPLTWNNEFSADQIHLRFEFSEAKVFSFDLSSG